MVCLNSGRSISHGIAELKPHFRLLHLVAVHDFLVKNAEIVADAVADGRQFERGHGVEKACGQTAEAAVAQAGIVFLVDDRFNVKPQIIASPVAASESSCRLMILSDRSRPRRNSMDK